MIFAKEPIIRAVLDAGPLFDVLIVEFAESVSHNRRDAILRQKRLSSFLKESVIGRRNLRALFGGIKTVFTTPHVIAEIQGLQQFRGALFSEFWRFSVQYFIRKNLDERLLSKFFQADSSESTLDLLCSLGPTDAGLIDLARETECLMLTNDSALFSVAWSNGVKCELVEPLIVEQAK